MTLSKTLIASFMAAVVASACAGNDPDDARDLGVSGFEAFRAQSEQIVDGQPLYVVESDIVLSLEDLREYYETRVDVHEAQARSTVARVNGLDDTWKNGKQLSLTYCVSTAFDTPDWPDHQRVVTDMLQAASDWAANGNVKFIYKASEDASCTASNPNVVIAVRPFDSATVGALAFFPHDVKGTLWVNLVGIDNDAIMTKKRLVGVLRHELGHILGLKHEHVRATTAGCAADSGDWAPLTAYDRDSVMHYVPCGNPDSSYAITAKDSEGVHELYGPLPARPVPLAFAAGCQQGAPRFNLTWYSARGVSASSFEAMVWRGSAWEAVSTDGAGSVAYTGVSGRTDYLSVRACNFFGCGGFSDPKPFTQTCF